MLCKINKTIGLIRKLQYALPRTALITLYKAFVRPHLDYGDIIYDQAHNALFHQKLESLQYNACLAITEAIRGSSREKIYRELGFESLQQCRWYRKLCSFYNIIPIRNPVYSTRNHPNIPLFKTNHNFFKNSFFLSTIIEWNNLDLNLRNSDTYGTFKNVILKFIRPSPNSVFECHNLQGIKFLRRLRLGLSHLREHKFKHSFQNSLSPLCKCGAEVESTTHFLLHCPIYSDDRCSLLSTIRNIDCKLLEITDFSLTHTLLYGNPSFDIITNSLILNATIDFILSTKRFEKALFSRNNRCFFSICFLIINQQTLCFVSNIHLVYIFNTKYSSDINLYIYFLKKYSVILVFFSFPDTLRIFRCLVIVNILFSICLCRTKFF